jgi:hypothetical protein
VSLKGVKIWEAFVDESFHTLLLWFFAGQVLVRGVLSQFSQSNAVSLSFVKRWELNREKKLTDLGNQTGERNLQMIYTMSTGLQTGSR